MAARPAKQALVDQFVADGLTVMFGNPGTVEQGFLATLEATPGMRYVLALQETVAAGIADGYARATGGPALLQLHSGVGLGNGVGMLYQAMRGHSPIVCVAGDSGVRYGAMDAQMAADLVAMARPVTKWAERVTHPSSLLRLVRRAVKVAMTPPRGPVFLALPMDVLDELIDDPVVPTVVPDTRTAPVPEVVGRAADLLRGAQRPLVLVGDGVSVSGAQAELVAVAERLGAPVWSVDSSEPNVPAGHPLSRGQLGHMFGKVSRAAVESADAVLIVGTYVFPEVFPDTDSPFAPDARVVHVDLDAWEIAKNHPVDLGVVADPRPTLAALAEALDARATLSEKRSAARRLEAARASAPTGPGPAPDSLLAQLCGRLAQAAGPDLMVFDEALTASPVVAHHIRADTPGSSYLTRGGSLGVGIPGAVGMKLAHPERPVVAFTGDGGAMYTYQALWTAARYRVGARAVVCNNHRYDLLNRNITEYWHEQGTPAGAYPRSFDLAEPPIDFAGLATALGADAMRVDKPGDVDAAVDRLLRDDDRPFLVDLSTDDLVRP